MRHPNIRIWDPLRGRRAFSISTLNILAQLAILYIANQRMRTNVVASDEPDPGH
jgi:hypothetical protein